MMRHLGWMLLVAFLVAACGKSGQPSLTFDGPSTDLKRTVVVATLDEPIPEGKNAIWCASFEVAWKELVKLAGEPIALEGDPPLATALNDAPDLRPAIPKDSLFTASGDGTKVRKDVNENVPDASPWITSQFADGYPAAYAYLNAEVAFPTPFVERKWPLRFADAAGATVQVNSFGTDDEHSEASRKALEQARVFSIRDEEEHGTRRAVEYAVDLCASSIPSQIIVAVIPREASLGAAVEKVQRVVSAGEDIIAKNPAEALGFNVADEDALAVPSLVWKVAHRFSELEGLDTRNAKLDNMPLVFAGQETRFYLNRYGATLRSEAGIAAREERPQSYYFSCPFLIYMKKRGADQPYFAMWVDNAELLQPWNEE